MDNLKPCEHKVTMDEYIDRETAISAILAEYPDAHYPGWYASILMRMPAADVAPVVHARWIHTQTEEDDWGHSFHHWHCSACGRFVGSNPEYDNYCPSCGAKMDGSVDNATD